MDQILPQNKIINQYSNKKENWGNNTNVNCDFLNLEDLNNNELRNKYDIIISDLTMPQMNGLELAGQLHQMQKDFPIVIITGFEDNLTIETQHKHGIKHVLNKPIMAKDLAMSLRAVLDK